MPEDILLASASPRRRRLLALLGVAYDIGAVDVPEDIPEEPVDPTGFAAGLAASKALAAAGGTAWDRVVLAADTIVVLDNEILGKPRDVAHASEMLRALSARAHTVITAVAIGTPGSSSPVVETVDSEVLMRELDDDAIQRWIDQGELLGCAGAYNIEGHLASVAPTECYQNVAGLPLCHLYLLLSARAPELDGLSSPRERCEVALGRTCTLGRKLLP